MAARKSTMDKVKETVAISATNIAARVKAFMPKAKPEPAKKGKVTTKAAKTKRKAVVKARKARKAKRR